MTIPASKASARCREAPAQPGDGNLALASWPDRNLQDPWYELVCVLGRNGSLWGLVRRTVTQTKRMLVYSEGGGQPGL